MQDRPLIVHIVFRLDYGGLENGVVNVVNRLSATGPFRHAIVALTEATSFRERLREGVPVYALGKRPGKDLGAYLELFRLLRRLRPVAVHNRNIGTLDCAVVAFLAGVPVRIHGEHGWDVLDPDGASRKYRAMRRLVAPFVHRIVTVSEDLRRWLVEDIRLPASKVVQICNGVDTEKFRPREPAEPRALPGEAGGDDGLVIGSVTRFSAIKDPLNLVEAFIRLRTEPETGASLRLFMIGDGELRDAALRRLDQAGLGEAAWLPGSRDDIPALLRSMDVFVLGSFREGISNTVLEAMASGLPVVATATGGNPELVAEGESGRLVPPAQPAALADAIRPYVRDAALRRAHGGRARIAAVSRFSIDAMVKDYGRLYDDALRSARPASYADGRADPRADGH